MTRIGDGHELFASDVEHGEGYGGAAVVDFTPLSPHLRSLQRRPQQPHLKSKFLAASDHQVATYEFENFTATWEHRRFAGSGADKSRFGCYFYGSKGTFHMGWRDGWTFFPNSKGAAEVHQDPNFDNQKDGHNVPHYGVISWIQSKPGASRSPM